MRAATRAVEGHLAELMGGATYDGAGSGRDDSDGKGFTAQLAALTHDEAPAPAPAPVAAPPPPPPPPAEGGGSGGGGGYAVASEQHGYLLEGLAPAAAAGARSLSSSAGSSRLGAARSRLRCSFDRRSSSFGKRTPHRQW